MAIVDDSICKNITLRSTMIKIIYWNNSSRSSNSQEMVIMGSEVTFMIKVIMKKVMKNKHMMIIMITILKII